ncbi:hypothetical protein [Pseudoalteromonas sp. 1181_04]|uniref:hypothetical protein n=1 Tax=Pseudoalteromonas sp. 1181_04 TaxID=2604450 RepID=UPI0040634FB5
MQINLPRHFGIAVCSASGYFYFDMETPSMNCTLGRGFLPGTGWLGFNPNHGILIGNTHIAVASSAIPENTMPIMVVYGASQHRN